MAVEPFKHLLNTAVVQRLADSLLRAWPAFDTARFAHQASHGLETRELKARALHICTALEATLPADFDTAAALLEATMRGDGALDGWVLWPVGEFVARRGLTTPERALQVLHTMTQRFTAEFAIRPFIVQHPALVYTTLQRWATDASPHVRRLVSEGSRPRLPWGLRLQALVHDPAPTLPLLAALQDDPSEDVQRSVANHLNDIAKDHPEVLAGWLETHLPGSPAPRRAMLRHASRTLIKQGHPRVLAAWGLGRPLDGSAELQVAPGRIGLGESITLSLVLSSRSAQPQPLVIDYAVHHVKADGSSRPKVFKGWRLVLPAHATVPLRKAHAVRLITTRRYHAGRHVVAVQVNGAVITQGEFMLTLPP